MSRKYVQLTEVILSSAFYTSGRTDDFIVAPTTETATLLSRYRLLFGPTLKGSRSSWSVLQENIDGSPLLPMPAEWRMRFVMSLKNGNFLNFTELPSIGRNEVLFFANRNGTANLHDVAFDKHELVGHPFTWDNLIGTPATVTATELDGTAFRSFNVGIENGVGQARIDLEGLPVGRYSLKRDNLAPDRTVYYDPQLVGSDVFAVIHLANKAPLAVATTHQVAFAVREERWKYYVVLKGNHSDFTYRIKDGSGAGSPLTFADHASVLPAYNLNAHPEDVAAQAMLASIYGAPAVNVFVSSQSIPYREATRSLIKLERTQDAITYQSVMGNLPNPPEGKAHAAVVVSVDPPNPIGP